MDSRGGVFFFFALTEHLKRRRYFDILDIASGKRALALGQSIVINLYDVISLFPFSFFYALTHSVLSLLRFSSPFFSKTNDEKFSFLPFFLVNILTVKTRKKKK